MADQLSLRLEPTALRLPATLRPMLPQPALEPFDSSEHLFEPNWGGTRVLAFIEGAPDEGRAPLRLLDEHGRDLAPVLPELGSLGDRVASESAVLDGEIVVVDRLGRADARALASRLRGRPGPVVAFLVFDVLYRDGRPLLTMTLERRRDILRRLLKPGDEAVAVPAIAGEGRALYAAIVGAGLAGVMARSRLSPYLPGVRSRLWQFVARRGPAMEQAAGPANASGAPAAGDVESAPDAGAPAGNAPMLALIRRLPLDEDGPE